MRKKLFEAREDAGYAIWGSGTIHASLTDRRKMKVHERHPDAPLSPIYFSLRPDGIKDGKLLSEHFKKIGYAMSLMAISGGLFKSTTYTWTAGIPAAGEPILAAMKNTLGPRRQSHLLEFKLEKTEDENGRRISDIHPDYQSAVPCDGESIVLVDDLMTNLATKEEAIKVVEAHGAQVSHLLLFLDRSIDGTTKLKQRFGVTALALWNFDALLEFGLANHYLSRATFEAIVQYPHELQQYLDQHVA